MQSRHNVTGIQYQGRLMSDYINISLATQCIAGNYHRIRVLWCLFFVDCFWTYELTVYIQWLKYQLLVFFVWDVKGCQHSPPSLTSPFVQTWAPLMHPKCPLWAPIHQPLTYRRGSERRDHLLFKYLKGWGNSHEVYFSEQWICRSMFGLMWLLQIYRTRFHCGI